MPMEVLLCFCLALTLICGCPPLQPGCSAGSTCGACRLRSPAATRRRLSRLQRLSLLTHDRLLPLGPYSASLRVLGTRIWCLNRSTALLASCGGLEHVVALCSDCSVPGPFWQWAEQHASLRRL